MFQQRPCEAEEMRDQAGHRLSSTEQTIDPLQTVQSNPVIEEENIQPFKTTCQDLLAEQKLIEETCVNLNKVCTQTDEEELLEARLNENESITKDLAKLQEMYKKQKQRACRPAERTKQPNEEQGKGLDGAAMGEEERAAQAARQLEGDQQDRLQLEPEMLKQLLAEKQDTIFKIQREKCDLAASATQKVDSPKQTSKVKAKNEGDSFSPTQEVAVPDSSVLSTKSLRDERFPKPELEISFTPLKPDRINVRKPGEESVTIKLRRTARKRKSPEMQNSVESENLKNRRLKVNNRENLQFVETPTVQGKKVSQLKQKDSPASLKGKKDGALQKIGDFIQSSPTLFGSKAKKIMSMVNVKSPELPNASENNKPKRSKRKLFKTQVSSPLDIPSHPVIGSNEDDKESDHLIIKRKLRTRTAKRCVI